MRAHQTVCASYPYCIMLIFNKCFGKNKIVKQLYSNDPLIPSPFQEKVVLELNLQINVEPSAILWYSCYKTENVLSYNKNTLSTEYIYYWMCLMNNFIALYIRIDLNQFDRRIMFLLSTLSPCGKIIYILGHGWNKLLPTWNIFSGK